MNENVNLKNILKNCPKGFNLYSKVHGTVTFYEMQASNYPILVTTTDNFVTSFTKEGKTIRRYKGECILVPSLEQQDWSKFEAPWYTPE